jgi:electron transport complex protein RnfC
MIERTEDLLKGLKMIMQALDVKQGRIGVEDNKPEAIAILEKATANHPEIFVDVVKTKYPQGAEKMLIKAAIGRSVPPGKLPMDVGVVIQNIGTALAIYDAVAKGIPAITAALTVSGKGIKEPKNLIVPIGTPLSDIIDFCGGMTPEVTKIVIGGPMMGTAQYDLSSSIQKATSGLLLLTEAEVGKAVETACVRCGNCVSVCPINLIPTTLIKCAQQNRPDDLVKFGIWNCMECGTCQYHCPANIPLVHWLRVGKLHAKNAADANK